ncbi:MAG: iron-sulfur cluster insertion protein ErpA [Alphaproteobacteria bacterium]|nr:iron-sulfur cluster insertion protein ErpA [Alphaproteobacteria bacterium]
MTTDTLPVSISSSAARRVAAILAKEPPGTMLRVAVNGGGCQGFSYDFSFDARPADEDMLIERDGARVLIDPMSAEYLQGSEIDWVDALIGASFQIRNPNAKSSCGCGTSFSL